MLDGMTNIKASEVLKEIKYYTEDLPPYSPDEVAEALEMAIKALEQQPTDAVSRSELQKTMDGLPLFRFVNNDHEEADDYYNCESVDMVIRNLPSVKPKYTDEEIDKAQAVEQAYVDKMVELAVKEIKERYSDAIGKMKKAIDEMTEIHSDGEFYIKNVDAKWIISKYLCGAEMSGGEEDGKDSACD